MLQTNKPITTLAEDFPRTAPDRQIASTNKDLPDLRRGDVPTSQYVSREWFRRASIGRTCPGLRNCFIKHMLTHLATGERREKAVFFSAFLVFPASRLFFPTVFERGGAVEYQSVGAVLDAVGHKVAVTFKLKTLIRLRLGQARLDNGLHHTPAVRDEDGQALRPQSYSSSSSYWPKRSSPGSGNTTSRGTKEERIWRHCWRVASLNPRGCVRVTNNR